MMNRMAILVRFTVLSICVLLAMVALIQRKRFLLPHEVPSAPTYGYMLGRGEEERGGEGREVDDADILYGVDIQERIQQSVEGVRMAVSNVSHPDCIPSFSLQIHCSESDTLWKCLSLNCKHRYWDWSCFVG